MQSLPIGAEQEALFRERPAAVHQVELFTLQNCRFYVPLVQHSVLHVFCCIAGVKATCWESLISAGTIHGAGQWGA